MYTSCLHSCGLVDTNHSDAKESMAAAALNVHFSGPSGPVLMAQDKHLHKEYAHECTWYIEVFGTQTRHSFMVPPFLLATHSLLSPLSLAHSHLPLTSLTSSRWETCTWVSPGTYIPVGPCFTSLLSVWFTASRSRTHSLYISRTDTRML